MKLFRRKPSLEQLLDDLLAHVETGSTKEIGVLLDEHPSLIDKANEYGMTPLLYAIYRNQPSVVSLLLQKGATTVMHHPRGASPLTLSILENQPLVARTLLEHGAAVDQEDIYRATPLMYAAQHGRYEIAALLLEKGANIEARDAEGETVLMYALTHNQLVIAKLLLEKGANPSARNFDTQDAYDKAFSPELKELLANFQTEGE